MNNTKKEEITVVFTGGKDSTLTAMLMCEQFKKVHLLTYVHSLSTHPERAVVNVKKLQNMFGKDKLTHEFISIDELSKKIYTSTYLHDLRKYKTYLAGCFCLACRQAMNTRTIIYNIENGIKFACDGSNRTSFGLSQMEWIIKEIKKFYKDYGINFETPVYSVPRCDLELLKKGIKSEKQQIFYGNDNTQGGCHGSNFHTFYLRLYYLPRYGREAHEKISSDYFREKLEFCRKYIDDYFSKKGIDLDRWRSTAT